MAATYVLPLASEIHWVRFLIGDTTVSPESAAILQDEEISALLVDEPNREYAAARAAELILLRTTASGSAGQEMIEKTVDDLTIRYGSANEDKRAAYKEHIEGLRKLGAEKLQPSPKRFRVLSRRTTWP